MRKLDDDKLLKILLKEKVIDPEDAQACKDYQKRHQEQRGTDVPLAEVLEKLGILTATRLDSLIRAVESSSVHDSIPIFTSTGKVDITKDDKPKIARATLGGMGKSKGLSVRKEIADQVADTASAPVPAPQEEIEENAEKAKTVSLFAVNQEKVISAKPKGPLKPETRSVPIKTEDTTATQSSEESSSSTDVRDVSLVSAYLLLIFLGVFGVHRYYLRKEKTAILYSLTLGFFFVGIIIDFLLMPWLVALARKEIRESTLEDIDLMETNSETPAWSIIQNGMDKLRSFLEFNIQWIFALSIPMILVVLSFVMAEYWICYLLLGTMALLLIVINENESLHSSVFHYIPFLSYMNNICHRLIAVYQQEKPNPTITYLLYPVIGPLSLKKKHKKYEFILLSGIFIVSIFTMLLSLLFEMTYFPTSESAQNYVSSSITFKLMALFTVIALLSMFITIMVRWRMQNKETMAQAASGWGTIIGFVALLSVYGVITNKDYTFSHKEEMMLQTRFADPDFCQTLEPICQSYLKYVISQPEWDEAKKQKELHLFIGGLVSPKELALFTVKQKQVNDLLTITWIDTPLQALAVINQDRVVDMRWDLLHSEARKSIEGQQYSKSNTYLKYLHNFLYEKTLHSEGLLKDLHK